MRTRKPSGSMYRAKLKSKKVDSVDSNLLSLSEGSNFSSDSLDELTQDVLLKVLKKIAPALELSVPTMLNSFVELTEVTARKYAELLRKADNLEKCQDIMDTFNPEFERSFQTLASLIEVLNTANTDTKKM